MTNWSAYNALPQAKAIIEYTEDDDQIVINLRRFCEFAEERQHIFDCKQAGLLPPWTFDTVLANHKFTNCYRILDRVSQYLIREIINPVLEEHKVFIQANGRLPYHVWHDLFCQVYIFKMFNKIETWKSIPKHVRQEPSAQLSELTVWARNYPGTLFSNAYLMAPPDGVEYRTRLGLYIGTLRKMLADHAPEKIHAMFGPSPLFQNMRGVFEYLRQFNGFGDFLAYQFALDFFYAMPRRPYLDDFVVPGPGCIRGMQKVFNGKLEKENMPAVLKEMTHNQYDLFYMFDIQFPFLSIDEERMTYEGLALNDFQNLFCEFDKYSRVAYPDMGKGYVKSKRSKIKAAYDFNNAKPVQPVVFPWAWTR